MPDSAVATLTAFLETKGLPARSVRCRITSDAVDLSGDRIIPAGLDVTDFLRNPVACVVHDLGSLPVARVVDLQRSATEIIALMTFPPEGVSPRSDEVYGLIQAGTLNAVSVSIIPDQVEVAA